MHVEDFKLFLHGLPPDCQESTLRDFLEGVCGFPGAITKVRIPSAKTYAFVTLADAEVANCLLGNTLLYCDNSGHFYQVKVCHYVKRQFRRKEVKCEVPSKESIDLKPIKNMYTPPEHVHQFTPDYSMLLLSKPKKKSRKGGDLTVWFGGVSSASYKQRPKLKKKRKKKKKKQASKQELHKSESFQFGNLCPESKRSNVNVADATSTAVVVEPVLPVQKTGLESGKQEDVPAVEVIHAEDQTSGVVKPVLPVHETSPESGKQKEIVHGLDNIHVEDQMAGVHVVEPVSPVHETCQGTGKQQKNVAVEVIHADDQTAGLVEPVLFVHRSYPESGKQKEIVPGFEVICREDQMGREHVVKVPGLPVDETGPKLSKPDEIVPGLEVIHAEDRLAAVQVVEAVLPVHETGPGSRKQDEIVNEVEVSQAEDQNATKPVSNNSPRTQVIIEHSYLGPLCLQFTNLLSVGDVKSEIMERTGLPIKDQDIYCNGKKLFDSHRPFVDCNQDSLTLTLSVGSLKGGVRPEETTVEGAITGEKNPSTSQEEAMQSMESWDAEKTTSWLCQIGLDKKYATICQKEDINGRALLLLARDANQLLSVFQLKKGPHTILMKHLKPHLETFEPDKPQTTHKSTTVMNDWTAKDLSSWLREIGISEESSTEAEEEEINGPAFLLLRESESELKECLKLKLGSWIILQHELLLHEKEQRSGETSYARKKGSTNKPNLPMPTKQINDSKAPLAAKDPSTKSLTETLSNPVLSKEEEKQFLLENALKLNIKPSGGSQHKNTCLVRSIFVKRGKAANALEKLLNFIVITRGEELQAHEARKLWAKIREKTPEWIKLLPEKDSTTFHWDEESKSCLLRPSLEEVSLRDGSVGQIFLEKISDDEYRKSCFVVLVDKQLLEGTYSFFFDSKHNRSYNIKLHIKDSKYHASFDASNPGLDLKWSKYFRSLKPTASDTKKTVSIPRQSDEKPFLTQDTPRPQSPRPFNSEVGTPCKFYRERSVLNCWETGPKDMITPVHEFKLFRVGVNSGEDESMKKFVYETLRFACGCLNERTNGTIHFGVADEVATQTCGYEPREIVGSSVSNKPLYNEKLTEFIDKCFVGESRSNVHNCIRPPVFVPVKDLLAEQQSSGKVVIEVDIEPSYSLCKGDIFKVGFKALDRGKTEREAHAYVRRGSQTKAIIDLQEMEDFIQNRLPKLDEQRKMREQADIQSVEKQIPLRNLFTKLKRLLCANKKVLDSSVYPILVLSKPDASMDQEILDITFRFVQKIKWLTVFDFDDHGTDSKGLCKVFKSGPDTPQCDIHEAEDYDEDDNVIEDIYCKTHWIFGNGYAKLGREAFGFKQWNNSTRKRGLSQVIQSLAKKIPEARAVVLFLLLSKDYQPVADTFKDFCTFLNGPNQLVYVAEDSEIVSEWEKTLSNTCLEEHELRERGVVGMSWTEFQECMLQMVCGTDRDQRYVTMATGSPYPLGNVSFNGIEIVSAKECEELNNLSSVQRSQLSSKAEINFYRGYPVTWMNFWFTDAQKNHVLRRDNYSELRNLIEKLHSRGTEGKVQTITLHHHIGAGASTMTRQALWDFRHNPRFPYRCAVVTKIDDNTCKELLYLRKIGYGEQSEVSLPPVLALVDNTDDFLFREFRSQVVEQSAKLPRTDSPVCVFLYCKPTQKPQDCYQKAKTNSVFLEQHLSQNEVNWFKDKYTEMKRKSNNKDPEKDFEIYASENLISFMIMKENYNPRYASSIVGRNLDLVTRDELTLLEYTSLLSLYNPYPVFASCFDMLMLSSSLLRKRIFRDWVENLTHSARIFLREVDCSPQFGTGKAIAIVHPIIAGELVDQIAVRKQTTVSRIILDFLKSPLLQSQGKSFTSTYLLDGANRMLKQRKKYEYGDDVQTKFSPLIEKILYVKDAGDGSKEPTEQSIHEAAGVLREGLDKFEDPMLAQQMARVFYVNAAAFSTSRIEDCFNKAFTYCNMAIERNSNDRIKSFLFDTMGRIFQSKIKILFDPIRNENRGIVIKDVTPVLSLAFEAMKWFQKSYEASADQHHCGFRGELSVMFYMLDVLRCTGIFRGREGLTRLRGYLAYCQVIPPEVQEPWSEFHEFIKDLKNRFAHCMEGLAEEFTVYKGSSEDAKLLPKQIARLKAQYHCYFGNGDMKWNLDKPEERWEHRWYQINQHLAGDIFSSVFKIRSTESKNVATETVLLLKKLAYENYQESVHVGCYKDLLLIVTTNMALHSPLGNSSRYKPAQSAEEYREVFKFVDKLFALEKCDESCKRIYAHLFKVMFLWPHKDQLSMLSDYRVEDFYDALKTLRKRWESKSKEHIDTDTKMLRQKVYKNMSFKKETKQYTTLFYLGKGTGLDAFVHINELTWSRTGKGSPDWEDPKTKQRLKRLTGVVESKNIITMKNPLDSKRTIEIYYSSFREGGFSKEEVSFFLGFSWPRPIALDVKYTNADNVKHSMEFKSTVFSSPDNQNQLGMPNYVLTYEDYTNRMGKLMKKLSEIESLKEKKNRGEELEENQEEKIGKEVEIKRKLQELKQNLDALSVLEEE